MIGLHASSITALGKEAGKKEVLLCGQGLWGKYKGIALQLQIIVYPSLLDQDVGLFFTNTVGFN